MKKSLRVLLFSQLCLGSITLAQTSQDLWNRGIEQSTPQFLASALYHGFCPTQSYIDESYRCAAFRQSVPVLNFLASKMLYPSWNGLDKAFHTAAMVTNLPVLNWFKSMADDKQLAHPSPAILQDIVNQATRYDKVGF